MAVVLVNENPWGPNTEERKFDVPLVLLHIPSVVRVLPVTIEYFSNLFVRGLESESVAHYEVGLEFEDSVGHGVLEPEEVGHVHLLLP